MIKLYIKRLYIGDFGIYKNETIKDINNGLVVVGGVNRAGKSTLLKILKNLPYGLSKGGDLPPPNDKYYIEATMEKDKDAYNLKLEGYKKPVITPNIEELYNIDKYTYNELFTIDLDLLNNNLRERKDIQTILLGAGFKEVLKVPKIIREIKKEGNKIGGIQGNPSSKQFKPFFNIINRNIKDREEALKEKDIYLQIKKELKELENQIEISVLEKEKKENKLTRLETIVNNYDDYIRLREIEGKINKEKYILDNYKGFSKEGIEVLKNEYERIKNELREKALVYENLSKGEQVDKKNLLNNLEELEYLNKEVYGLREQIKSYNVLNNENYNEKKNIINLINNLNSALKGNMNYLMNLECDYLWIDELHNLDQKYKELRAKEEGKGSLRNRNLIYIFVIIMTAFTSYLFIISVKNNLSKFMFVIVQFLISGSFIYIINRLSYGSEEDYKEIRNIENKFQEYKDMLKLEREVTSEGMVQYIKSIIAIKERINNFLLQEKKVLQFEKDIEIKREDIVKKINQCYINEDFNYSEATSIDYIMDKLEKLIQLGFKLKEVEIYLGNLNRCEEKILKYLNISKGNVKVQDVLEEHYKNVELSNELLELRDEKDKIIYKLKYSFLREDLGKDVYDKINNIFQEEFKNYGSIDEMKREVEELLQYNKNIKITIESLKEEKNKLSLKLEGLQKSSILEKIETQISKTRSDMKPLAEKYALYNCASYILEKAYNDFIDKSKDHILNEASNIFNKITNGEYDKLLLGDDLLDMDFKSHSSHSNLEKTTGELSRGTSEQLFLSVRLSRILSLDPLPVIIDDSLVNFDSSSLKSTLHIIKELSKRNQVFLLTCHPKLIQCIDELNIDSQYFMLDKGSFTPTDGKTLISCLS
ncbi:AAA family ATPase [Clostridium sp. MSJ-11]|uniref:AAA family ATPase n=1 Tax=Clostridium mobile TaxID=2841512 RepID=A0ABS6EI23_9CLOT|nr:AAA family ATPase [Clostridium mobile]MBU5484868.1 AAA family ATPase [Clostridium mobile]